MWMRESRRRCTLWCAVAALPFAVANLGGVSMLAEPADSLTQQSAMFAEGDAYERFMGRWSRQLAPLLVTFAAVGPEDSVLDVGSGTGALASALAGAIPRARVTGVDPSPAYVAYARARVTDDRVRFVVGDAQQLDLPDATFDRTLSLLVMNFIPDRDKALREMIRVTRPGGVSRPRSGTMAARCRCFVSSGTKPWHRRLASTRAMSDTCRSAGRASWPRSGRRTDSAASRSGQSRFRCPSARSTTTGGHSWVGRARPVPMPRR